jgi:hypothetical protein
LATFVVHVPAAFAQDLHVVVHPSTQQVPSMQNPEEHSAPDAHVCPLSFLQVPDPSQELTPVQPVSSVYFATLVVQVPALLAHDLHVVVQPLSQQRPSTQYPDEHSLACRQVWPLSFLHAPAPSQELVPVHVGELLASSTSLATFVVHAPVAFAHDLHVVVHAFWQQVPSTQKPLAHTRQLATLQSAFAATLQARPEALRATHAPNALQ